jgi:hypothetical protein
MYSVREIDRGQAEDIETLGAKRKFWISLADGRFLFKAEERGTGEDWAEKVVCELARELGVPHVEYEMAVAVEGGEVIQPGVICPNLAPRPLALILGNQLLYVRDPAYPAESQIKYGVSAHTVEAVADVLSGLQLPAPDWMKRAPAGIATALSIFTGYVMLDAWVANQDRHHQNWGAIQDGEILRLAPTFDHGASLARNLKDSKRQTHLNTRDKNQSVEHFAGKARSGFFKDGQDEKTMLTIDVFRHFAQLDPGGARIWLETLARVESDVVDAILAEVPPNRMSTITRQFTSALLGINQRRLLNELSQ